MSHSLLAKRSRSVSVKLSGSLERDLNMALASDSLFDKFGLWPQEHQEAVGAVAEPILPNFEDLDFGDLLEIKDEPLISGDSLMQETQELNVTNDPFTFNMESLVDEASLDSIKSDCMWSSVNLFNSTINDNVNSRKRRRDVSLTLSECAEGLLSINQLDVNMLDQIANEDLGSSPQFMTSSFGSFDNEDEEMSTDNDEDEDDEIDVVGTDLGGSSARTRLSHLAMNRNKKPVLNKIEAGRSLLKKQQPFLHSQNSSTILSEKNKIILDDHCYFLASKANASSPAKNAGLKGMLTPNESSEDEDFKDDVFKTGTTTMTSVVDKRKIAEAVQSLIKNRPLASSETNIKFKFRMKFKSTAHAASHMMSSKKAVSKALFEEAEQQQQRERRKSASKNAYCPPPASSKSSPVKSVIATNSAPKKQSSQGTSLLSNNRSKMDSEKCREIRDLHNSMERQRRVEQRNHLAYLKKQVPEVADMEKASKLTILRKAMDYCHLLSNMDSRIRKDKDKEQARNALLKKKLADLTAKHDARRVTTSGRLTGWSHGRY